LELLEAVISATVASVMLNVFGKVPWQRIVPFVDPQVPGRILESLAPWEVFCNINPFHLPESPNMYLSGIVVKLHNVQFSPTEFVMLEPFTEYS
jgi:hypothetical protein